MGKRVVTFGEIMLRLSPPGFERILQCTSFDAIYGGAESNVAVSLAQLGLDASFVTKLPSNQLGDAARNELRRWGVDTSYIVRGGDRLGIYFCEKGASQRPSLVVYDRADSSIATAKKNDFNWKKILKGADWFHFTGITPALSDDVAALVKKACMVCKEMGIRVSCDLNYRKKLWSKEKAGKVMGELMEYVDTCIANEEDAHDVFGISAKDTDIYGGQLSLDGYKSVCEQIVEKFGCKRVAITLRESISASVNNWSALLYDNGNFYTSQKYQIQIVDRVGGGDSFGAGLIYGIVNEFDPQDTLRFAVASSCLKHTIVGDQNIVSANEVLNLAKGDASGRVQR